ENLIILFSTLSNSLMKTFYPSTREHYIVTASFTEIAVYDRVYIDLFRIFCEYQFTDQYLLCAVEHFLLAGRKPLFLVPFHKDSDNVRDFINITASDLRHILTISLVPVVGDIHLVILEYLVHLAYITAVDHFPDPDVLDVLRGYHHLHVTQGHPQNVVILPMPQNLPLLDGLDHSCSMHGVN